MNVRRIAANKAEVLTLLYMLECTFDVIVLTEVGDEANRYINDTFLPGYNIFINAPTLNRYGGTAVIVKNDLGTSSRRNDLSLHQNCKCSDLNVEDLWIEIDTGKTKCWRYLPSPERIGCSLC